MTISISNNAVTALKASSAQAPQSRLRIQVIRGGCAGLKYQFTLDETIHETDSVFEKDGVAVVVDQDSLHCIAGATLDYVSDIASSGFVLDNPNAVRSCGCGRSFSDKKRC